MKQTYKRIFCVVIDSLGVGQLPDAADYGDHNVDTFGHILDHSKDFKLHTLRQLGLLNLHGLGIKPVDVPLGYYHKCQELSKGKDTITGHYELMGLETKHPFLTFPDGFPKPLLDVIEQQCGYPVIGNCAASGTEIIERLGAEQIATNSMIVYTSADSVLQIAVDEDTFTLAELYRCCEVVRKITTTSEWRVGRVIARPYRVIDGVYKRTSNRKDYALDPFGKTALSLLKDHKYDVISVGKIADIFNHVGITKAHHSDSSVHGMQQTIDICKNLPFNGLCFTNLVDFDALWGHRRNVDGYMQELETFDVLLKSLVECLRDDDLLILCADHGNDPTYIGSDHTREYIPVVYYNKTCTGSGLLPISSSFQSVGATILDNFNLIDDMPHSKPYSYLQYIK